MTEEYFDKACQVHDDILDTAELIAKLRELEDKEEMDDRFRFIWDHRKEEHYRSLANLAIEYLFIIRQILKNSSVIAQLQMVQEELKNQFENLEPREEER